MAISFLQSAISASDATTYTFSSQSLGTARSDRYIVVGVAARGLGTTRTISSISIGGVSATINNQVTNVTGGNSTVAAIAMAAVPTGTTGDVVVTFDSGMIRCGIGMYRVTNLTSATPTDTGSSTANDPTDTLATSTGGFAIGVAYSAENTTPSASWTGVTETYDEYLEGTQAHSGGFSDGNAGTPLAITCNWANGSVAAGSFATWNDTAADPASGPANLKTYNTNALANIKTINTNAIANVKTLNTNA